MKKNEDGFLYLNEEDIYEYLKNRPPLLMINEAHVKPGEIATSKRVLKEDEWFFKCHFPGNPMMPGVLQQEALFNTAALAIKTIDGNKEKTTNISAISKVKYRRHILPNEEIYIKTCVEKFRRGLGFIKGEIYVGTELCMDAEFILVVLDDVISL